MKKLFTILLALITPLLSKAYDAQVNGIYYYLDHAHKTATVTYSMKYNGDYTGHVFIPKEISYNNNKYSVISIYDEAFSGCSMLSSVTIPNSVVSIGHHAFYGCGKLTSIYIPNSVTSIGDKAFYETGWYNNQKNGLLYLDNWLLGYKGDPPIGELIIDEETKGIADWAFSDCTGITSVNFPNTIKYIGEGAISGCSGLSSISIPNSVTSVGRYAFDGTGWYNNQGDGLLYLDNWLLGYKNISPKGELKIAEGTKGVTASAFVYCSDITNLSIPNSVFSIGKFAFNNCGLASIIVEEGNLNYDSRDNCNAIIDKNTNELILGCKNTIIPNSVTFIGDYAFNVFDGVRDLKSISIPNSVTTIGNGAFGYSGLTSIDIPNSVTTLGDYVFDRCSDLVSVNISNSVSFIGRYAFHFCKSLSSISIPNSITELNTGLFCYCSNLSSVTIPKSIISFKEDVFQGCSNLASISIPDNVTMIGERAFSYCSSLESLFIPKSVNSIGKGIVSYCSNLTNIMVESDNRTFDSRDNCNAIIETSSNTLKAGCKGTFIPENVTSIADYAFEYCYGLTNIIIPNSVKTIGKYAFYGCKDLKSIELPNDLKTIPYEAFRRCDNLTTVVIPRAVTSIYYYAFAYCKNLKDIYCYPKEVPVTYSDVFLNVEIQKANLHVPEVSIELYKNAEPWKNFGNIVAIETTSIEKINENVDINTSYNLNGMRLSTPQKGINVLRLTNGKTKKVFLKSATNCHAN